MSLSDCAHTIKRRIDNLAWELRRASGDIDRLDGRIADECWCHPEAMPMIDLAAAEQELRTLADSIKERREKLLTNKSKVAA